MAKYEFSFDTSVALANAAARFYIWRRAGWRLIAILVAVVTLLTLIVSGIREWYLFVTLGIGIAKIAAWFGFYQRASRYIDVMESKQVHVRISEDGIAMEDTDGGGHVKWTTPVNILKSAKLWLFSHGETRIYTYMPIEVLSDEIQSYVERKAIEGGGSVS